MKSTELCTTDVNPDPQAIGACMDTTQVGVLLVSLFNPLFKLSRLHCFDVCLFSARAFWLYAHAQEVPHVGTFTPLALGPELSSFLREECAGQCGQFVIVHGSVCDV